MENILKAKNLKNQSNRTLLFGINKKNEFLHIYLEDGIIEGLKYKPKNIYNNNPSKVYKSGINILKYFNENLISSNKDYISDFVFFVDKTDTEFHNRLVSLNKKNINKKNGFGQSFPIYTYKQAENNDILNIENEINKKSFLIQENIPKKQYSDVKVLTHLMHNLSISSLESNAILFNKQLESVKDIFCDTFNIENNFSNEEFLDLINGNEIYEEIEDYLNKMEAIGVQPVEEKVVLKEMEEIRELALEHTQLNQLNVLENNKKNKKRLSL